MTLHHSPENKSTASGTNAVPTLVLSGAIILLKVALCTTKDEWYVKN